MLVVRRQMCDASVLRRHTYMGVGWTRLVVDDDGVRYKRWKCVWFCNYY